MMANAGVLSDVFKAVRLRGTVYFRAAFRSPWGLEMAPGEFANFHIVNSGHCWLRVAGDAELIALEPGDAVIPTRGRNHGSLDSNSLHTG